MTNSVPLSQRLARRGAWRLRRKSATKKSKTKEPCSTLKAQVSQATRDRLIQEALASPAYTGMTVEEVTAYINSKLDAFVAPASLIAAYPLWYGRLAKDQPRKPMTDGQRQALEKARQRKVAIQLEVARPYAPETPYERPSEETGL